MIGETIDDQYLIESVLSSGPTGTVYLATGISDGEPVAIKFVETLSDADRNRLYKQLQADFKGLAALDHPGFSRAYGFGLHKGEPYLVSSYADETPLTWEIELAPLSMERAIHICHEIGQLLSELHSYGIVHGDLRPENVTLTPTMELPYVKLIGFGFTWAQDLSARGDEDLIYFAPEQIQGQQADVGTDLYSLGAILYALSTGHLPPPEPDMLMTSPTLSQLNPKIPASLENLVLELLNSDPDSRPSSAEVTAAMLGQIWENDLFAPDENATTDESGFF